MVLKQQLMKFACILGVVLLFSPCQTTAQQPLFKIHGNLSQAFFGSSVAYIGDVNQDGVVDFAVGQPSFESVGNSVPGRVVVYSGKTALPIYAVLGRNKMALGAAVKAAGLVNGDNIPDFAVASNGYITQPSCVTNPSGEKPEITIHSGLDGSIIRTIVTPQFQGPASLETISDLNNDGVSEIVAGFPSCSCAFNNPCNQCKGCVKVYSGATGAQVYSFTDPDYNKGLGATVGKIGDINNDGKLEYIASGFSNSTTRIFSGATGVVIRTTTGADIPQFCSNSPFASIGDIDSDGRNDYAMGRGTGGVTVYSGLSGSVLYTIPPSTASPYEIFGVNVRSTDDKNGDGFSDIAIGANYHSNTGVPYVRVVSGTNGSTIYTFFGLQFSDFGTDFDASADITGDGQKDFLIGAFNESTLGNTSNGVVYAPVNPAPECTFFKIGNAVVCI